MNPPQVRLWAEQLLLRGGLPRVSAAHPRPQFLARAFSSLPPQASFQRHALHILRNERTALAPRLRPRRLKSDKPSQTPNPTPHLGSPQPAPTLSQRLKRLSKEYGWLAVGVYFAMSALDFPFCYLAVRMLGTERVGHYEHVVIEGIKTALRIPFPSLFKGADQIEGPIAEEIREATAREEALGHDGAKVVAQNGGAEACMRRVFLSGFEKAY